MRLVLNKKFKDEDEDLKYEPNLLDELQEEIKINP